MSHVVCVCVGTYSSVYGASHYSICLVYLHCYKELTVHKKIYSKKKHKHINRVLISCLCLSGEVLVYEEKHGESYPHHDPNYLCDLPVQPVGASRG